MTKKHSIKLQKTGSGGGAIIVHPQREWFLPGEKVSLEAVAKDDSYFKSWEIRVNFKLFDNEESKNHTKITLLMPDEGEEKIFHINAIFESMFLDVGIDSLNSNRYKMVDVENKLVLASLKWNYYLTSQDKMAYCYVLELLNLTDVPLKIKVPLTERVIVSGEKIPQKKWGGSINGVKGIVLDPSGFCSLYLVYLNNPAPHEKINVVVDLLDQGLRLNFNFQAPPHRVSLGHIYELTDCQTQELGERKPSKKGSEEWGVLISRIDGLESTLSEALSRIKILEQYLPAQKNEATPEVSDLPTQTLPEVLAWLCTQNNVPLAVLRQKLLPLSLMPSAVMDDVNERAFDVAGEPALDEAAGTVTVQRGVLLQVLAVL